MILILFCCILFCLGSRIHTTADFGFVTLDIMQTVPEDSGVYMCKAINKAGEAVSSTSFKVKRMFYNFFIYLVPVNSNIYWS